MVQLSSSGSPRDEAILAGHWANSYAPTCDSFAAAHGLDLWDVRDVAGEMLVTESDGGFVYGNDGQGYREPTTPADRTPWNWDTENARPIGTPESRARMRAILRRSIDEVWLAEHGLVVDKVGDNGRSTGPAQQLSEETGGAWGPMAGTMRPEVSVGMFLAEVDWNNRSTVYKGKTMANWQTAMLLRVQQPLPDEVAKNYGSAQLARAQRIVRDPRFAPGRTPNQPHWLDQALLRRSA